MRFTTIDLAATSDVRLDAGQLLTGIHMLNEFALVETEICQSLIDDNPDADGSTPEHAITMRPIDVFLRPKGFNGRLLKGYVALLPFSADRVKALDKRHTYQRETEPLTDERPGWRAFFGGILRKTSAGTAPFVRETLYFQKARMRPGYGVSRVVGPTPTLEWTPIQRSRQGQEAGTATPGATQWLRSTRHTSSRRFV